MSVYRFYDAVTSGTEVGPALPPGYSLRYWKPSWTRTPPRQIRSPVQWVWWLFHGIGLFRNADFSVVTIERDGHLVHRAGIFPGYFRFPFMGRDDLQIGDTWTAPTERGRGLAGLAISTVLASFSRSGRKFWYVVEESNGASIRVIEKAGFRLAGTGVRLPRASLASLGYFAIATGAGDSSPSNPTITVTRS